MFLKSILKGVDLPKEYGKSKGLPAGVDSATLATLYNLESEETKGKLKSSLLKSSLTARLQSIETAKSEKDKTLLTKKIDLYRSIFQSIENFSDTQEVSELIDSEKAVYRKRISDLESEMKNSFFLSENDKETQVQDVKRYLELLGSKKSGVVRIHSITSIKNLFDDSDVKTYAIERMSVPDGTGLTTVRIPVDEFIKAVELTAGNSKLNSKGIPASLQVGVSSDSPIYSKIFDCLVNADSQKFGNKIKLALGSFRVVNDEVVVKNTARAI